MEITQTKTGDTLVIHLAGRLDASWSVAVQKEFDATVRRGEHQIDLDMSKVDYISSAGLGVLLTLYKELHAIKGSFSISTASPFVESALKLAGLASLISKPREKPPEPAIKTGRTESSPQATYDIFDLGGGGINLAIIGNPDVLHKGGDFSQKFTFGEKSFALGIGALGAEKSGCEKLFGEFLALAGSAAFQPVDGSNRPDFLVSKGHLVPEGHLVLGLVGDGSFSLLARFEAKSESRTVGLAELAAAALDFSGTSAVAIAAITETAGLIGTNLRQSPTQSAAQGRFDFPGIRDWLSFSNERLFRDSTSLITGVASRGNSKFDSLLRPLGGGVLGHFHAAAFPYRPLQKGLIELKLAVDSLFEGNILNAVLHLLNDDREFSGAGESEFLRGALWIAPINSKP